MRQRRTAGYTSGTPRLGVADADKHIIHFKEEIEKNGRTWTEWEPISFITKTPTGVKRQYAQPGWAVPGTERLLIMVLEGTLPTDNPLEGMKNWILRYRVSLDGGKTFAVDEQVIQDGDYSPNHPLDGVWFGKNSFMIGATTCRPIHTRHGHFLVPVQITPLGPDGEYYNPGGGYTFHEAAVSASYQRTRVTEHRRALRRRLESRGGVVQKVSEGRAIQRSARCSAGWSRRSTR